MEIWMFSTVYITARPVPSQIIRSTHSKTMTLKSTLILSSCTLLIFLLVSFLLGFFIKTLYVLLSPISATFPTHFILSAFNSQTIFHDENWSWSSLFQYSMQSARSSSFLGPNFLLSSLQSNTLACVLLTIRKTKFHTLIMKKTQT